MTLLTISLKCMLHRSDYVKLTNTINLTQKGMMEPYRKKVDLPSGSDYWFVHMGPIPNTPDWHQAMYQHQAYPFPTKAAADLFAQTHAARYPGRTITVEQGK